MPVFRLLLGHCTAFSLKSEVPKRPYYTARTAQRCWRTSRSYESQSAIPSLCSLSSSFPKYPTTTTSLTSLKLSQQNHDRSTAAYQQKQHRTSRAAWQKDLNPSQVEAVTKPLTSITRVIAGPGSGKTRVLTSRIAYLLQEDPNARILAVTFTRKAAGEMQQRLETLLRTANNPSDTTSRSSDASSLSPPSNPRNENTNIIVEEEFSEGASSPTYVRDLARVTLGTFHKICADILRYNGNLLASLPTVRDEMIGRNATLLDGSFAIMDQSDQLRIMKECLVEASVDLKETGIKPLQILNAIGDLKASIVKGEDPFQASSEQKKKKVPKQVEIAMNIYGRYRETMLSNNLLDFDDLIYMARELLMENPEVRQQLHRRWTHILVDEYQDTSRAQIDLVRLWTSSSLLVVGDGDQSIYSWRGADPNSLSTFGDEFQNFLGDIETVHLTENYRSTPNIVHAAHKVITAEETSQARKLRQKMNPKRESGSAPRIVACSDGKAEANFVVKSIQNKLESGQYTPDTSISVLYRTNAQSRLLEEACVNNNLPYVILGKATSFYKRREIKDCLCYLRWLYNCRDKGSMIRAFQTPSRGLGEKAIEQFEQYCTLVEEADPSIGRPKLTPFDVLLSFLAPEEDWMPTRKDTLATRPLKLFTEFAGQMQALRDKAYSEPVESVLAFAISEFDLIAHLDKTSDSKSEFEERQRNVQELQQATRRYTKDGPSLQDSSQAGSANDQLDMESNKSPLGAFLDDVALVTETATEADQEGGGSQNKRFVVSLMTIHASKGMEFDGVFVVGNEDNNFPTAQAIQAGKGSVALEEECRLCYVAMTRAKSELFLTWRRESAEFNPKAATGFMYVKRNRSRFLEALVKKKQDSTSAEGSKQDDGYGTNTKIDMSQRRNGTARSYSTGTRSPPSQQRRSSSSKSQTMPIRAARTSNTFSTTNGRTSPSISRAPSPEIQPPQRRQRDMQLQRRQTPRDLPQRNNHKRPLAEDPSNTLRREKRAPPRKFSAASNTMDSTWFYPVGSLVIHKKHGRGLVLNPPPPTDKMLVRVKFDDGQSLDVPAQGDDLRPDLNF